MRTIWGFLSWRCLSPFKQSCMPPGLVCECHSKLLAVYDGKIVWNSSTRPGANNLKYPSEAPMFHAYHGIFFYCQTCRAFANFEPWVFLEKIPPIQFRCTLDFKFTSRYSENSIEALGTLSLRNRPKFKCD